MQVVRAAGVPVTRSPRGAAIRKLLANEAFQVTDLMLKDGEAVDTHVTPVDVFFYVVRGRGVIEVGEERATVETADIVFSPRNIPHAVRSLPGGGQFEVLVVKNPASR